MTTPDDLSDIIREDHIHAVITSYGDGHHDAPQGSALHIDTRSLRNPPEDPAVRERMLHSNGLDPEVRHYVLATPGAKQLIERATDQARTLIALSTHPLPGGQLLRADIHVVCGGGRHRSVAVAEEIAANLRAAGLGVEVEHRHIDRPILPH
jgi:UPF0042 nucleotide-binding protein